MTKAQLRDLPAAREYLRVSQDKSGRLRSPAEQHADNEELGHDLGFRLTGEAYAEGAVSASRYGGKVRGQFQALLADLRAGTFGADVLVLWESSRASRQIAEWTDLVDACEAAGVRIAVTVDERMYNPAKGRDRKELLAGGLDAEYEARKMSDRISRASAASAAAGECWGPCAFGYERTYDPKTGNVTGQVAKPGEAEIVRELFARVRRGHSLNSIARDFTARGITGRRGKPLHPATLRSMALRPAYAGLRIHQQGNGRTAADIARALEGAVPAIWEPLIDAETFYSVQRRLFAHTAPPSRGAAATLLGMIARCYRCGTAMSTNHAQGIRIYRCRAGCASIREDELDEWAVDHMVRYLAGKDAEQVLSAGARSAELARVRGELEAARAELAQLRAAAAAGQLSVATLLAVEPARVKAVAELEARDRVLSTPEELDGYITRGGTRAEVQARWDAVAEPRTRRAIARAIFAPGLAGWLCVRPAPHRCHNLKADERVALAQDSDGTRAEVEQRWAAYVRPGNGRKVAA